MGDCNLENSQQNDFMGIHIHHLPLISTIALLCLLSKVSSAVRLGAILIYTQKHLAELFRTYFATGGLGQWEAWQNLLEKLET